MPTFEVATPQRTYQAVVQRGALARLAAYVPEGARKLIIVSTEDVWNLHGRKLERGLAGRAFNVIFFRGGEERKRLAEVERLAGEMVSLGADRSSLLAAFGGGVATDVGGFLAAVFMRGIPVIQIPTTLLAQVDAGVGGKTGVNLVAGKNLVGAFHQPLAALIDPDVLSTLPEREYRAGLYEVIKCGVIRSPELFHLMSGQAEAVLGRSPEAVDRMIAESVRIKAEVVSADERESDLRRILNFGHTYGHALEAETGYARFLHGEAVAFGMKAASQLAVNAGLLGAEDARRIIETVESYGPIPALDGVAAEAIVSRLARDKKTLQGRVHFVLPEAIGRVRIVSGMEEAAVLAAARAALA
ncbi:MAG: 3-dehydroquinate synthase [Bryobacterales bacterium]|nr:3-dehydroquinate synthase [Bryobacterales bacterium]